MPIGKFKFDSTYGQLPLNSKFMVQGKNGIYTKIPFMYVDTMSGLSQPSKEYAGLLSSLSEHADVKYTGYANAVCISTGDFIEFSDDQDVYTDLPQHAKDAQRGLNLDDISQPGSGAWSMSEINNAYKNENQSEDVDLHLGSSDEVEEPYSSGNGPLGTRFDDKIDPVKTAQTIRLYTGWGTTEHQDLYDFDSKPVRNIEPLGEYWTFDVYDDGAWISLESMEQPELVGATDSLDDTLEGVLPKHTIMAAIPFLDRVKKEVDALYEDGLQEVDVRQAILNRYGRRVYDVMFN